MDTPSRPILGRVLFSLFNASPFLNAFNNVSLSNFKAERFVHRFQPLFLRLYFSLDLRYHRCEFLLTFFSRLSIDIVSFALSVGASRAVSALVEVVVYHRHTARAGFATFGLVRLEIGRGGIYLYPFFIPWNFGFCSANLAVYLCCCLSLHCVGYMAVDINCRFGRNMTYCCRERFHVHSVFKCHRRECLPLWYNKS